MLIDSFINSHETQFKLHSSYMFWWVRGTTANIIHGSFMEVIVAILASYGFKFTWNILFPSVKYCLLWTAKQSNACLQLNLAYKIFSHINWCSAFFDFFSRFAIRHFRLLCLSEASALTRFSTSTLRPPRLNVIDREINGEIGSNIRSRVRFKCI